MSRRATPVCLLALATVALSTCVATAAEGPVQSPQGHPLARAAKEKAALERAWRADTPIYCGGGRRRLVALTFDDGPGPYTSRLVALLKRRGVEATFFEIGRQVTAATTLEQTVGAVGDHTWDHPDLTRLKPSQVAWEINAARAQIDRHLSSPTRLFRAPGGAHDASVDAVVHAQGLIEIGWSLDSLDWAVDSGAAVYRDVDTSALRPGAIVLLHEIHPQDLAALPAILDELSRRHLTPVTIPELLALDMPTSAQLAEDARARSCVHLTRQPWPQVTPLPWPFN